MIAALWIRADAEARRWLDAHPATEPRVIAYDVTRCCGGARICSVSVRKRSGKDDVGRHVTAVLDDGTRMLVDRRAAERLPRRFGLTVRGVGPFRHLDLDLDGEGWATLLYD